MKKIIFLLFIAFCFTPSVLEAQTITANTKAKKRPDKKTAKKVKTPPIHIKEFSDIRFVAPRTLINTPDTPIIRINLITGETSVFRGESIYVFKSNCEACFSIRPAELDTSSSEKLAKKAFIFTGQYKALVFDTEGYNAFKRANLETEPEIVTQRKIIDEAQKRIDAIKEERRKAKQ